MEKIFGWIKAHPLETGGCVLVAGIAFIYLRSSSGSSSSSSSDNSGAAAYYAAESAQAQAGDQLQAVQIEAQASTAQTQLNDATTIATNTTWANAQVNENTSNNAEATTLAPYQETESLYSTLGSIASIAPTTSTSTSSSSDSGFFGLGASSSTQSTTTVTPNASATTASELLDELVTSGFHASS